MKFKDDYKILELAASPNLHKDQLLLDKLINNIGSNINKLFINNDFDLVFLPAIDPVNFIYEMFWRISFSEDDSVT